ncbi:hypothetical protein [Flavobacterium foetidum]|uniref:hypothetical protein n=1 Tax=Flavobacterium foetidum TaxID=2026681 RepID=UPI001075733F|nr:hypothetical protein [Flavobacterium foetidum]KAF2517202.1 hypothetical protein E0W73_03640 [Flavobacterium foetidum]
MELNAQIRIIVILLFAFIRNYTAAQHKIDKDVTFSFKGKNNYAVLNSFLGNFKLDEIISEDCTSISGIIKFQITPNGKIGPIIVEGNLPETLIKAVEARISLTENNWVFSESIIKNNKNIQFYYPIYIELPSKCNFKIHESYYLLKQLFENQKVLRIKDGVYYIEPLVWYAAVR